ncbi:MAG TPA: hypothetical protein DDY20_01640 [Desulfobulbaceae bacterium]|nr:hypothetical protein [Desulfobulbaceae bacterium]
MKGSVVPGSSDFQARSRTAGKQRLPSAFLRQSILILPTRYGFIFLAMLAALLLGAVNHNNNLGYLLVFLLGGMALVSILHTRRAVSRLALSPARSKPVFAGQKAIFAFTVKTSDSACPAISFQFVEGEPTTFILRGGNPTSAQASLNAGQRGLLRPGPLVVAATYPLGLFLARRSLPVHAICLVYPRPVPGPLVTVPGPDNRENEGDAGGCGVEDFSGLEVYQPGDPLQHISWKSYSRGQGLYTKKFEGTRGKSLYFNPDSLPGLDFELRLSRICYMILKADAMRAPYGLHLGNRLVKPGLGEKHKHQCLRELALAGHKKA